MILTEDVFQWATTTREQIIADGINFNRGYPYLVPEVTERIGGKLTQDGYLETALWVFGIYVGGKTVQGATASLKEKKP